MCVCVCILPGNVLSDFLRLFMSVLFENKLPNSQTLPIAILSSCLQCRKHLIFGK